LNHSSTYSTFSSKQISTAVYLALVVFCTYASIFAFRKPFTVATFEGLKFWNVSYQTLLIIMVSNSFPSYNGLGDGKQV
jgi:hypothetical protein